MKFTKIQTLSAQEVLDLQVVLDFNFWIRIVNWCVSIHNHCSKSDLIAIILKIFL